MILKVKYGLKVGLDRGGNMEKRGMIIINCTLV